MLRAATAPLLVGGATVLALDVARRIFRHTQIFCPEEAPLLSWDPADYGIARKQWQEVWFETLDGEELYGWYCHAEKPIASALYCHGNTGNLSNTAHVIPHLMNAGISVLLFDYRGFGRSSGYPSLDGVVSDGVCAAKFHDKIRPKHLPSIIYGYSLGGAIAAQVIRRHPFDGMILQSTFTSLPDIAKASFPRVPLYLVAGNLFDTVKVLRKLQVPLMLIHGSEDETCPKWMAERLRAACASRSTVVMIEGGMHKDLYVRDSDSIVWAVNRFATELPRNTQVPVEPVGPVEQLIDAAFRHVRRQLRRRPAHQPL